MNEVATEFHEKVLMFNPIGQRTYEMSLLGEQDTYSYPPRTILPVRKTGSVLTITLQCHVSNAFCLKGPYVRIGVEDGSSDEVHLGNISMDVEGENVLKDVPLGIKPGKEKRYQPEFGRAGECQFFAFPWTASEFERQKADGLFLPNGSLVKVQVTGVKEDLPVEIGFVMAEYRGKWPPRDERRIS